jgi:hypothetical protein
MTGLVCSQTAQWLGRSATFLAAHLALVSVHATKPGQEFALMDFCFALLQLSSGRNLLALPLTPCSFPSYGTLAGDFPDAAFFLAYSYFCGWMTYSWLRTWNGMMPVAGSRQVVKSVRLVLLSSRRLRRIGTSLPVTWASDSALQSGKKLANRLSTLVSCWTRLQAGFSFRKRSFLSSALALRHCVMRTRFLCENSHLFGDEYCTTRSALCM